MSDTWGRLHRYLDTFSHQGGASRIRRYSFVLILVFIFFLIKTSLSSLIGRDIPFLFSLFIVILSSWYGGFRPGIFATILTGALTFFFFLEPRFTFLGIENPSNLLLLFAFFVEGLIISYFSELHRRSDQQRSEFIGVISHELKNPLTSISGYSKMIERSSSRKGDVKTTHYAERISLQIKQLTMMINEMLDITKIETGRFTYQPEQFVLSDLVKELIADQQVTTNTHKIVLSGKSKVLIFADKYRIGQVINNLLSNAIKYSPQAKQIEVRLKDSGKWVEVHVKDNGAGISPADQRKLFQPFFRAKNTQGAKGTGIGLFISSQIVQAHSGFLSVKSRLGKGSIFSVKLPTVNQSGK